MKPVISIISAAYRHWMYRDFYDSISAGANIPFEIVFVGPNPPTQKMPDNFKYIQTNVKPAQCQEIAARNAMGKYLIVGSDDERFSQDFLNKLHNYIQRLDRDKVLISFRYQHAGVVRDNQLCLHVGIIASPFVGVAPCFRRDLWNHLGGIDRKWAGSYSDVDMQMRFYEYGMQPFLAPDCIIDEVQSLKRDRRHTLYARCGFSGKDLIEKLWSKEDGTRLGNRLWPVEPFEDKEILIKNQGVDTSTGKKGLFRYE